MTRVRRVFLLLCILASWSNPSFAESGPDAQASDRMPLSQQACQSYFEEIHEDVWVQRRDSFWWCDAPAPSHHMVLIAMGYAAGRKTQGDKQGTQLFWSINENEDGLAAMALQWKHRTKRAANYAIAEQYLKDFEVNAVLPTKELQKEAQQIQDKGWEYVLFDETPHARAPLFAIYNRLTGIAIVAGLVPRKDKDGYVGFVDAETYLASLGKLRRLQSIPSNAFLLVGTSSPSQTISFRDIAQYVEDNEQLYSEMKRISRRGYALHEALRFFDAESGERRQFVERWYPSLMTEHNPLIFSLD